MDQPRPLLNGWHVETRLSELQKHEKLYLTAQQMGISAERDYIWQSDGHAPRTARDVATMLAELERLTPQKVPKATPRNASLG